ncbi:hypothetical protein PR048_014003 [Dryococelus australis]|uniref:Uncharacterized protein n=1 Tax=Dryococelus australis TaxID=614101 RepID=A0ABQ9HUP8_9NEOP|nr:hypothetical protein PR048_014003 [Dryococelus australis]
MDEALFTREGIFKTAITAIILVRPYILLDRLRSGNYHVFVYEVLPLLLEDVPLAVRQQLWFQHDGAHPHCDVNFRNCVNQRFHNHWIGRGGPVSWRPRSPDLTPMNLYFCGGR